MILTESGIGLNDDQDNQAGQDTGYDEALRMSSLWVHL